MLNYGQIMIICRRSSLCMGSCRA